MLKKVLIKRVEAGTSKVVFEVSEDDFRVISDFLFDMDVAYLHPRRDAMHVSLMASQYSNIQLPARAAIFSNHSADVPRAAAKFSPSSKGAIFQSYKDVPRAAAKFSTSSKGAIFPSSKDVPRAAERFSTSSKGAIFQESESFLRSPRASSPANLLRK